MTRDEILNRIVTVRSYLKRQLSKRAREEAQTRLSELEDELRRLDELAKVETLAPDRALAEIEKIKAIIRR